MDKTNVMKQFEELSKVPRSSFNNEKIIDYCINWAGLHGFPVSCDEFGNVLITKKAVKGQEERPGLIIQGHLDMVPVCDAGVVHDWKNDPIDIYIDGDFYKAKGTTLGADDGVAAAIGFALLEDESLKNPNLELLLTTDEEVGMLGVKDADLTVLKGKNLINIDSGPEGEFTVGCCGGKLMKAIVHEKYEKAAGYVAEIRINGLTGGHSGMEITKERANALKLMGEALYRVSLQGNTRICSLSAEGKDNAISSEASCVIAAEVSPEDLKAIISDTERKYRHIFRLTDPDLTITAVDAHADKMLCMNESRALAFLLHELPYGVQNFEQTLDTVESSVNLGLVETDEKGVGIYVSIRSSVAERIEEMAGHVRDLCDICGARAEDQEKSYPAWLSDRDSKFLRKAMEIYKDYSGKDPVVSTTHGGLECGYIMANSNIESIVAIGPDSWGEHTTSEKLSISSLNRTYEFVRRIVEKA